MKITKIEKIGPKEVVDISVTNSAYIDSNGVVSHNCKYCLRLLFMPDGITPKVFKLSEIMTNGTNFGRKAAEWKAVQDVIHPNCRHLILELPEGFGFKNGKLQFISLDHNEYKTQSE